MGWNGSTPHCDRPTINRGHSPVKKCSPRRMSFAIGLFVIAVVAIGLIIKPRNHTREVTSSVLEPAKTNATISIRPSIIKPKPKAQNPEEDPRFEGRDKSRIRRAANGKYVYLPARGEPEKYPGERAQALALIGGSNKTVRLDFRIKEDPDHPLMFHNQLQRDLVQFARPGEFAVPINPNIADEVVWQAIKDPIIDHENDSDRQLEEKQYVRDLLSDLKKHMEGGGQASEYFLQLCERQKLEEETMKLTRDNVRRMINAGELKEAKSLQDEYNKVLREKGLPPLNFRKLRAVGATESYK